MSFLLSCTDEKKPYFYSDAYQFRAILPNLNYHVTQGVTQGVTQESLDDAIKALIKENSKISTDAIAMKLNVSSRTVKRHIDKIDELRFVGSGYSGYWELDE